MSEICFYFIRHGETLLNKLGKVQGRVDSPLTEDGCKAACLLRKIFERMDISTVYSSDLPRAYATAEIICQGFREVQKDERIREWCLGSLEGIPAWELVDIIVKNTGLNAEELNTHLPLVCDTIKELDRTGMAESFDDIAARLLNFLKEVGNNYLTESSNIMVVTHAFVIKTLIHLFDFDRLKNINTVGNSSIAIISYDGNDFCVKDIVNS